MILQCTECKARYLVPDQAIGATGRTVRCANCSHSWFQQGAADFSGKVLDDLDKVLDNINARVKARPVPKGSNLPAVRKGVPGGIKTAAVALTALAASLVVLLFMPAIFGMPPSKGTVLADIALVKLPDKESAYEISGRIVNLESKPRSAPSLRVMLVDAAGKPLRESWDFSGRGKEIEAGKDVPFYTGPLEIRVVKGARFVVELGSPLELALRRKPE